MESLGRVDCVIIGAGVVGLAVARALALSGREVIVVEAEGGFGTVTSSRNSEVIHAGLYYPPGSLKARFCETGRRKLYAYCAARRIAHHRIGKLVVAARAEERSVLEEIARRGAANGADDLKLIEGAEARRMEPALQAEAALFSPSTGIVDSHGFMASLADEAQTAGAAFAYRTPVLSGTIEDDHVALFLSGTDPCRIEARCVVNAAGLAAHRVAAAIDGAERDAIPTVRYAKGNYFGLSGRAPFSHLIYPVPEPGGLGVHLTLDLSGRARFGPDVEWIDAADIMIDYAVDPGRATPFYAAIRRYWPGLPDGALQPDYSGVRVKAGDSGDFVIDTRTPRLINLFGIESPGLTSALAIGDHVAELVDH